MKLLLFPGGELREEGSLKCFTFPSKDNGKSYVLGPSGNLFMLKHIDLKEGSFFVDQIVVKSTGCLHELN